MALGDSCNNVTVEAPTAAMARVLIVAMLGLTFVALLAIMGYIIFVVYTQDHPSARVTTSYKERGVPNIEKEDTEKCCTRRRKEHHQVL